LTTIELALVFLKTKIVIRFFLLYILSIIKAIINKRCKTILIASNCKKLENNSLIEKRMLLNDNLIEKDISRVSIFVAKMFENFVKLKNNFWLVLNYRCIFWKVIVTRDFVIRILINKELFKFVAFFIESRLDSSLRNLLFDNYVCK